ncbi:MAG TPA: hypothetical protein VGR95_13240 [Thermoanaerobaculia bacterium]|jgi:hypothetical protein|nr:hypothetical protein [Thermoanaerobaculia bacterium]
MRRRDIHQSYDFFEYVRTDAGVPAADPRVIDVALLDMNHSWPNVGHDSIVHAVLECAESLATADLKVRVLSFDVRRRNALPEAAGGRFALYIGTGGPGYLDPRLNDGVSEFAQGIQETDAWEAPLFRLFDSIVAHPDAALIGVCHTFGLMCRWSGAAHPELREEKSSGMPANVLSDAAPDHPWFSQFAGELPDHRHFRVVDNRLFDLVLDGGGVTPIAFENEHSGTVTMAEFARAGDMPRVWGVNHHPEIIDREHLLGVLREKRAHGEVTAQWYEERSHTLENEMVGDAEQQSRLTSEYTFLGVLRHHLQRLIEEKSGSALSRAV